MSFRRQGNRLRPLQELAIRGGLLTEIIPHFHPFFKLLLFRGAVHVPDEGGVVSLSSLRGLETLTGAEFAELPQRPQRIISALSDTDFWDR